ncbi:helix-turn-helix domain-containing protein [Paenibacillus sp. USHLN196]|uniref:helix-turn-helix domain-containing protein n=1 Tax=Paenibacillus sp. USHLN196 TaxID=3081291 RepID=UPI0030190BF4
MPRIPIRTLSSNGDDELDELRKHYKSWRINNSNMNAPFFALFRSFKEKGILKELDEGALRLYLYFGFVSGNEEGTSWHSVQTIANYFDVQTRTIDNWIKKLVDEGLIYRTRDHKKSNTTFLIPYTDTFVHIQPKKKHKVDNQALLDDLIQSVGRLSAVYGSIINVYHIFHWGLDQRSKEVKLDKPKTNFLFIITKRSNDGVLVGHRHNLTHSDLYGVSELEIEDVVVFESPFLYKNDNVTGLAVNHKFRLRTKNGAETNMEMMRDLAAVEKDELLQHSKVEYGLISKFFDDESDESESEEEGGD